MAHHFFGGLAFSLLLFHPLFLAYNYLLISFKDAALFLLPGAVAAQNFGIIGLFLMIITLVITFYTRLKYQIWKFTHKFLGLAFIFAFMHTFLIGADIASNKLLKYYLLVLGIVAIILYFYRTVFAGLLVKTFEYSITNIEEHEDKIWEITFTPKNKEIKFVPGQFAFVKLFNKELSKEAHPFSFSSAGGNPLKIAVKELGDYTNKINWLKAGDLASFEGPFGSFNFKNYGEKQIWIAGGIGITPFLSMLRGLTPADADYKIDLYYSVKNETCLAFQKELGEISKINKNLNVHFWVSHTKGFLKAESIYTNVADLMNRDILICGPGIMMSELKGQLLLQGVKKKQIHINSIEVL
jgi:predicted ferric reductase